ncbi:MAG: hypothetical protein NC205_07770 [Prevotella sp.]|nr:hypothetical protein [Alistipes senegalensis]MCM1358478.1 hypothetical protein [Prevotella sp.]MCM1473694.1 hypothetical protein [Muribaculaceae bacterium]
MIMCADVIEVNNDNLLVRDTRTGQEVIVHTPCTCRLNVGDRIRIVYSGAMTNSLPPQISSRKIFRISGQCI